MKSLFLGMDVGGTHTRAVLMNQTSVVVGQGDAPSANPHNVGLELTRRCLREAATKAWADAGLSFQPARHVFLGCAGVKSSAEILEMRSLAEGEGLAPVGEVTVENDLSNSLTGGLSGRPGIALNAGTGANCLGRDANGKTFMCGGWGWLLDDKGSGFGLALEAIRAAARAADGRERPTSLSTAVLAFFGISEPNELLSCFYTRKWTPGSVGEFAPVVMRHAVAGDFVAKRILTSGARALAALVVGVKRCLKFPPGTEVVLLGGCGRSGAPYQDLVEKEILANAPGLRLVEPEGSSLAGAALNALSAGGIRPAFSLKERPLKL